jgi:RNA ligase
MKLNEPEINELRSLIADGMVNDRRHSSLPLTIYSYSKSAQFAPRSVWSPMLSLCRGLVLDDTYNIVAHPLKKFWNIEEESAFKIKELLNLQYTVTKKMDGSLGILFNYNGQWIWATRGSFISEQSLEAYKIHNEKNYSYEVLNPQYTYLFEILYPQNRIVVDYGDTRELILLAIFDRNSGEEILQYPPQYPLVSNEALASPSELKSKNIINEEGYVIRFSNGMRTKIKFENYVTLHGIMTECTNLRIWSALSSGESWDSLIELIPDEFYAGMQDVINEFNTEYDSMLSAAKIIADRYSNFPSRKEFAIEVTTCYSKISGVIFALLRSEEEASKIIWGLLKPKEIFKIKIKGQ